MVHKEPFNLLVKGVARVWKLNHTRKTEKFATHMLDKEIDRETLEEGVEPLSPLQSQDLMPFLNQI